jgi:hypothetical protein
MRRKLITVGIVVAGLVFVGGMAVASIPDAQGVIHGCLKSDGSLRVIDSAAHTCPKGTTPLNWNQAGPQGPTGPAGPAASVVNVVKHYDSNNSGIQSNSGAGHIIDSVHCPPGKHVLNGGVSTWTPDPSWPEDGYRGAAYDGSDDEGWSIDGGFALPRPVDGDTGWRLATFVALPSDFNTPRTFYPIDVTYFVICA